MTSDTEAAAGPRLLLILGSNVDADAQLDRALAHIREDFAVVATSLRHPSPAAGAIAAPAYLNQAALIRSTWPRGDIKARLRAIEAALGRERPASTSGLCAIDIDLVARIDEPGELWDTKSWNAPYARALAADLQIQGVTQFDNTDPPVQPLIDTL